MIDIQLYLSLEKHMSNGMSTFQMENFVINDSITPYRKLRQIIVETRARLENVTSIGFDIEELQIKKERVEKKIAGLEQRAENDSREYNDVRLLQVQMRRFEFELNRKQSILDQQNAEMQFFHNQLTDLVNNMFGGQAKLVEDLKNPTFHADNEKLFWTNKLARGAATDLINFGVVSKGVMDAVLNLSPEQQQKIMALATTQFEVMRSDLAFARDEALSLLDK